MTAHFRAAVLGLGGIGSAAAYWLARRSGSEVIGIEQFPFGHANGGSEDHSRIIRLSYHTPGYVRLAARAYEAWEMVEVDSGEPLVLRTGGLDLADVDATIGLTDYRSSLTEERIPFEDLDAAEIMRRWPQWHLPETATGIFQERTGIAMASRANATHRRLATGYGAVLHADEPVTGIVEHADDVEIRTADGSISAEVAIIAAGAWSNRLVGHLGVRFPLDVTLEQVVYRRTTDPLAFHPSRFPVWIWMDQPCFYGFPIFGEPAVKLAWDRCEVVTDVETRSFEPRRDVIDALDRFAARHLPGVDGDVLAAKTCLYTLTPDRDFVIGPVPGCDRVLVAIGAGHAFKFASLIGKTLAELALDGHTDIDLATFAPDRAILSAPDPVRTYMV